MTKKQHRGMAFFLALLLVCSILPTSVVKAIQTDASTQSLSQNDSFFTKEEILDREKKAQSTVSNNNVSNNSAESQKQEEEAEPVRILFVGNSFTDYAKGCPGASVKLQLEALCKENQKTVKIKNVAKNGAYLAYYCNPVAGYESYYYELLNALRDTKWDYVVLQEQTTSPFWAYDTQMKPSILALKKMVYELNPGAKVLLYMPQGFEIRNENASSNRQMSEADMQKRVAAAYDRLGMELGLSVVPVGVNVASVRQKYPQLSLHQADQKHPATAGYYMAAVSFFREIFGSSPVVNVTNQPGLTISQDIAENFIRISEKAIRSDKRTITTEVGKTSPLSVFDETGKAVTKVKYMSLDSRVATVDKTGQILGVSGGKTSIVATAEDGHQAFCHVTVKEKLHFGRAYYLAGQGERIKISPFGTAENVSWSSSNRRVARVNRDGEIQTKGPGKTIITVSNQEKPYEQASFVLHVSCERVENVKVELAKTALSGKKRVSYRISWSGVSGATKYLVYRGQKKNGTYKLIGSTSKRFFVDHKALAGTTRFYKVVASTKDELAKSEYSVPVKARTLQNPKLLSIKRKNKICTITWEKKKRAAGYVIYRSPKKKGEYTQIATVSNKGKCRYQDKTRGKKYYYKVVGYMKKGTQPMK